MKHEILVTGTTLDHFGIVSEYTHKLPAYGETYHSAADSLLRSKIDAFVGPTWAGTKPCHQR